MSAASARPMPLRSNFGHLADLDDQLVRLGVLAEKYFADDPNTSLLKLRQFGETMAQLVASRFGVFTSVDETQYETLRRLREQGILPYEIHQLFGELRMLGNQANHAGRGDHRAALSVLKFATQLGFWFQRTFGKADFKPGPFVPPAPAVDESAELRAERDRLNQQLTEYQATHHQSQQRLQALETRLREATDEQTVWEQLALETEAAKAELAQKLAQTQAQQRDRQELDALVEGARQAAGRVELDEAETRKLIDSQLHEVGWTTDSQTLTYASGARPQKGRNLAIAAWPTLGRQAADYVLFAGLVPLAVVEAKRANVDVAGKISQAERYSRGFKPSPEWQMAWTEQARTLPWPDAQGAFHIPFAYSSNGRPFHRQLLEKSGTWFRDLREPSRCARCLQQFHSPEGLLDLLRRDRETAEAQLRAEPYGYLQLRDYQQRAIAAVEMALASDQRTCLLAMATGTGKTRTILGLMYRLLKTERFRRILFLVDRTALGDQALDVFRDAPLEQSLPLSKIYNIAELGDMAAEAETRIQVATVQAMAQRVFASENAPGIDAYDCIIVDEAHRGYTLDQEMSEGELEVREVARYLSTYRRVLDYFDAVKVGLTATPAKHTSEIFGKPVFTYSYREAVADDWLVDHEPPIRYITQLSQNGIHFEKGETVHAVNTGTGELETAELDDELHFEVEAFNRRVITEDFNRVICDELVQQLDPNGDEKTMIFCATNLHADMVKRLLDKAFGEMYGDAYNQSAVAKITGSVDRVRDLIKRFKNERYPSIALTVDLLTTGIDVPKICHLVFLRRVRSRILFEQMLGRATRRCDEIGKTVFRIHDPVDIYADLEAVNTMKPLVKDPKLGIDDLLTELADPRSAQAPGVVPGTSHAHDVLAMLSQRLMRVLRKAAKKAATDPVVKSKLDELGTLWGIEPTHLHQHLQKLGPQNALGFLQTHRNLGRQLDEVRSLMGWENFPLISDAPDVLISHEQLADNYSRPDDYLQSFKEFIQHSLNESVALAVVVNRPRDLTRQQLREIRLFLDEKGYSETRLRVAWRNKTNHEIAAGVIAYIRQAALGEDVIAYSERVARAMVKIKAMQAWSPIQLRWLDRLAQQLSHELVIDKAFLNEVFATDGGTKVLDKLLGQKLEAVLETLSEALWAA